MAVSEGSVWEFSLGLTAISTYKREEMYHIRMWQNIFIIRLWVNGYMMSCTLKETVYCSSCKLLNIDIFSKHCTIKGWKGWLDSECCVCLFRFVFFMTRSLWMLGRYLTTEPLRPNIWSSLCSSQAIVLCCIMGHLRSHTYAQWSFNGKKSQSNSWKRKLIP